MFTVLKVKGCCWEEKKSRFMIWIVKAHGFPSKKAGQSDRIAVERSEKEKSD
jgi:hypothetical protein